jgi:hypothetical protein
MGRTQEELTSLPFYVRSILKGLELLLPIPPKKLILGSAFL